MTKKAYKELWTGVLPEEGDDTTINQVSGIREITDWANLGTGSEEGELVAYSDGTNRAILSWDSSNSKWVFISSAGEWVLIEDWSSGTVRSSLWAQNYINGSVTYTVDSVNNELIINTPGSAALENIGFSFKDILGSFASLKCEARCENTSLSSGFLNALSGLGFETGPFNHSVTNGVFRTDSSPPNRTEAKHRPDVGSNVDIVSTSLSNPSNSIEIEGHIFEVNGKHIFHAATYEEGILVDDSTNTTESELIQSSLTLTIFLHAANTSSTSGDIYIGKIYIKI